ncbi:MAG: DUF4011 domain-containing protein [Clostridia bacterium]|nr:DUF4011 domain-containing protein [Clostridia bacterium]
MQDGYNVELTLKAKIDYWKERLLNIDSKNRLINYAGNKCLGITVPSFDTVFDRFVIKEERLELMHQISRNSDYRMFAALQLMGVMGSPVNVMKGDFRGSESDAESFRILRRLRNEARIKQEDQGIDTLYLSFGFLKWVDNRISTKTVLNSPLLLVPASIELDSINSVAYIQKGDEDPVVNSTLVYHLGKEHGIILPKYNDGRGPNDPKETASEYLARVADAVKHKGWEVNASCSIGIVSFSQINMFRDLTDNTALVMQNPIIRAICGDYSGLIRPEQFKTAVAGRDGVFDIDAIESKEMYQVVDADSSQQDAVLLASHGCSFLLEGPPGTGKSQTITNIIAQAMADGKKILFVSEKLAALQVVYKRLCDCGLGEFCLVLHNNTSRKQMVDQLSEVIELVKEADAELDTHIDDDLETRDRLRTELNDYAKLLHTPEEPSGLCRYDVYNRILDCSDAPYIKLEDFCRDVFNMSQVEINHLVSIVGNFETSRKALIECQNADCWKDIKIVAISLETRAMLERAFKPAAEALASLSELLASLNEQTNAGLAPGVSELDGFKTLVDAIVKYSDLPKALMSRSNEDLDTLAQSAIVLKDTFEREHRIVDELTAAFNTIDIDFNAWLDRLTELYNAYRTVTTGLPAAETPDAAALAALVSSASENIGICTDLKTLAQDMDKEEADFASLTEIFKTTDPSKPEVLSSKLEYRRLMSSVITLAKDAMRIAKFITVDPADTERCTKAFEALKDFSGDISRFARIKSELSKRWRSEIFSADLKEIYDRFTSRYTELFNPYDEDFRRDARYLRSFAKEYVNIADISSFVTDLQNIFEVAKCERMLRDKGEIYADLFGSIFNGIDTDLEILKLSVNYSYSLNRLFGGNVPERIRNMHQNGLAPSIVARFVNAGNIDIADKTDKLTAMLDKVSFNSTNAAGLSVTDKITGYTDKLSAVCNETVKSYSDSGVLADKDPAQVLACVKDYLGLGGYLTTVYSNIGVDRVNTLIGILGDAYQGDRTDWDSVISSIEKAKALADETCADQCVSILSGADSVSDLVALCTSAKTACDSINATVGAATDMFYNSENLTAMSVQELGARLTACLESFTSLRAIVDYRASKSEMTNAGLAAFANAAERENCVDGIVKAFKVELYKLWLDGQRKHHNVTSIPDRSRHNAINEEFETLDSAQFTVARRRIRKKVLDGIPSVTNPTHEMRLLLEEVNNSKHSYSIRRLLKHTVDVLPLLKPCMMMSPQSVSFYLESAGSDKSYKFDMVVFDEASQVLPEHAISALIRANQAIIVGDTKQMPPSQLFMLGASDTESQNTITIGEGGVVTVESNGQSEQTASSNQPSALDLALQASGKKDEDDGLLSTDNSASILEETKNALDSYSLIWHYRSRYEQLISFSNDRWYHSLVTFPEAVTGERDTGVEYIKVTDGMYRGGSSMRNNPREAVECVKQIIRHMNLYPDRSLGVIAMNVSQAELIENILLKFRAANTEYEPFFSEDRSEPFFIKSVENIQGDERDTIIFSTTYGLDENGKFKKIFGSLSAPGGERRLNVAVTRSKGNFKVVTSLTPEMFGSSESLTNEGTKILYEYIKYARDIAPRPMAENFTEVGDEIIYTPDIAQDTDTQDVTFVQTADTAQDANAEAEQTPEFVAPKTATDSVVGLIGEFLESQGYKIRYSVGNSLKYTVDIAVCDPDDESHYIAGIECDGYVYGRARTARDRDRLKRQVLRRMGWNMYRIWSTDWIIDSETEKNELVKYLSGLRQSV